MAGKRDSFRDYILDQLKPLDGLACRSMFGGHGLYEGDMFFGILHDGRVFFKTDERTRKEYVARGMSPFAPTPRQTLTSYYEVPADVVDDGEELVGWARTAVAVARKAGKAPRRRR